MAKKQVLGKGIRALIPEYGEGIDAGEDPRQIVQLGVDEIEPNPHQTRKNFDEGHLQNLVRSIQEKGVIQPVAVNRVGQSYQLIAGERIRPLRRLSGGVRIVLAIGAMLLLAIFVMVFIIAMTAAN